jgi:proteasome lid subunit RPN8/RPN11
MIAQAVAELPNECCGLLAGLVQGDVARVSRRYPLVNDKASPKLYLSEGKSLITAHVDARKSGLDFLAVYHSHPTSPPIPSRTDLDANYWPGVIHFIISLAGDPPEMGGWWLDPEDYRPAEWRIEE